MNKIIIIIACIICMSGYSHSEIYHKPYKINKIILKNINCSKKLFAEPDTSIVFKYYFDNVKIIKINKAEQSMFEELPETCKKIILTEPFTCRILLLIYLSNNKVDTLYINCNKNFAYKSNIYMLNYKLVDFINNFLKDKI